MTWSAEVLVAMIMTSRILCEVGGVTLRRRLSWLRADKCAPLHRRNEGSGWLQPEAMAAGCFWSA